MGGSKKVDTSASDKLAKLQAEQAAALEKENKAKLAAIRGGRTGRSLLTYGATGELGVQQSGTSTVLGAGTPQ